MLVTLARSSLVLPYSPYPDNPYLYPESDTYLCCDYDYSNQIFWGIPANNESIDPNSLRRHIDFCLVLERDKQCRTIDCTLRGPHSGHMTSLVPSQSKTALSQKTLSIAQLFITLCFCIFCTRFYSGILHDQHMFFHSSGDVLLCHSDEDRSTVQ